MVSSDEDSSSSMQGTAEDEVESFDQNIEVPAKKAKKVWKPRKPRTATKWPKDTMTVTEIDDEGMPTDKEAKRRMRRLAGLIARHHIPLNLPDFKSLGKEEKSDLFTNYIQPYLEFLEAMEELGKKEAMRLVASCFRNYKSSLFRDFLAKGLEPCKRYSHISPKDWCEFAELKGTDESKSQSEKFRDLRKKNTLDHHLGTAGYDGKIPHWEAEDDKMAAEGIQNPWEEFPKGRSRNFLRARSELTISQGNAKITWKSDATKSISENIIEKNEESLQSGITWVREKDVLSACLGPEHPGRARGVSSSKGWKHAWSECIGMYRKRKKPSIDIAAIKAEVTKEVREELRLEFRQEFMAMLSAHGQQLVPLSRTPSPATGRSSCASASEAPGVDTMADDGMIDPIQDTINLLDGPASCALNINPGGYQLEVARGRVHPEHCIAHQYLMGMQWF